MLMPKRPAPRRCALTAGLSIALAAGPWCAAHAAPKWSIERPVAKGQHSPLAAAPLQKQAAHDKELAERYPIHVERIDVEGLREREFRREPPRTTEQRFADRLNEGSPELVAGRTYDGYYYDGTIFWGADPLSFAWKNLTHWLKH